MRVRVIRSLVLIGVLLGPASAWATTYAIDQDHSTVSFKVRHLFSKVEGTFNDVEGRFTYAPGQPADWQASVTIQAASLDTRHDERDQHLRSADFFHVEQFPTLTFRSTQVSDVTPTSAKLHGVLSLHGVERPVVLDIVIHGEGPDPWGKVRSGFTATTTINRKDFGIIWNKVLDNGQFLIGDEVEIIVEVEGLAAL